MAAEPRIDEGEEDVPPHLQQVRADGAGLFESARRRVVLVVPRFHRSDEVHHARLQKNVSNVVSPTDHNLDPFLPTQLCRDVSDSELLRHDTTQDV